MFHFFRHKYVFQGIKNLIEVKKLQSIEKLLFTLQIILEICCNLVIENRSNIQKSIVEKLSSFFRK